jgi:sensor histidine kinase YesM
MNNSGVSSNPCANHQARVQLHTQQNARVIYLAYLVLVISISWVVAVSICSRILWRLCIPITFVSLLLVPIVSSIPLIRILRLTPSGRRLSLNKEVENEQRFQKNMDDINHLLAIIELG